MESENYINLTTEIPDGGAGNRARNIKAPNTRILLELNGKKYISYVPGLLPQCDFVAGEIDWQWKSAHWINFERVLEIRANPIGRYNEQEIQEISAALLAEGWTEI